MLGLMDPAAALHHRWAGVVEGADIIAGLVCDHQRLEMESDGAEQLFGRYPGS
jgi:hypothetical protein